MAFVCYIYLGKVMMEAYQGMKDLAPLNPGYQLSIQKLYVCIVRHSLNFKIWKCCICNGNNNMCWFYLKAV